MKRNKKTSVKEPAWLDARKDRRTPYTEEELELFVDGFISSMNDVVDWERMVNAVGEIRAREILKEGFRRMDPNR